MSCVHVSACRPALVSSLQAVGTVFLSLFLCLQSQAVELGMFTPGIVLLMRLKLPHVSPGHPEPTY